MAIKTTKTTSIKECSLLSACIMVQAKEIMKQISVQANNWQEKTQK